MIKNLKKKWIILGSSSMVALPLVTAISCNTPGSWEHQQDVKDETSRIYDYINGIRSTGVTGGVGPYKDINLKQLTPDEINALGLSNFVPNPHFEYILNVYPSATTDTSRDYTITILTPGAIGQTLSISIPYSSSITNPSGTPPTGGTNPAGTPPTGGTTSGDTSSGTTSGGTTSGTTPQPTPVAPGAPTVGVGVTRANPEDPNDKILANGEQANVLVPNGFTSQLTGAQFSRMTYPMVLSTSDARNIGIVLTQGFQYEVTNPPIISGDQMTIQVLVLKNGTPSDGPSTLIVPLSNGQSAGNVDQLAVDAAYNHFTTIFASPISSQVTVAEVQSLANGVHPSGQLATNLLILPIQSCVYTIRNFSLVNTLMTFDLEISRGTATPKTVHLTYNLQP